MTTRETVDQVLRQSHEHTAETTRTYTWHKSETCSCGANRRIDNETGEATQWAHPESTLCG